MDISEEQSNKTSRKQPRKNGYQIEHLRIMTYEYKNQLKNRGNSRFELKIDSEVFPVLQEWWANVIEYENYLESRLKIVDFMTHPVFCFSIITQTSDL